MSGTPDYSDSSVNAIPLDTEPPPQGVVVVLVREGRVLLIRRGPGVRAAGWWCFPGGGLDAGETAEQALMREIREELGIEVEPVRPLWRAATAWGVDLVWWLAAWSPRPGNETLRGDGEEVAEARWVTREEALALDRLLGSNRAFFEQGLDRGLS